MTDFLPISASVRENIDFMKIAKYTLYLEIHDHDRLTATELQQMIENRLLNQAAINGTCLVIEEKSRVIDVDRWTHKQWDKRPLNQLKNISNPDVWEKELDTYQ